MLGSPQQYSMVALRDTTRTEIECFSRELLPSRNTRGDRPQDPPISCRGAVGVFKCILPRVTSLSGVLSLHQRNTFTRVTLSTAGEQLRPANRLQASAYVMRVG